MRTLLLLMLTALATTTAGITQQPAAPKPIRPTRSLADGLVRERIESQRLELPQLVGGDELGRGQGPLAMLVRKRDGSLELVELARGEADTGPSPEPQRLDPPPEQEAGVAGRPKPKPKPVAARRAQPVKVTLDRRATDAGPVLEVGLEQFPKQSGAELDAEMLGERFSELSGQRTGTDVAGVLLIEAMPDAMVQDVVALWQIAAQHGFDRPLFGGMANGPLPEETKALLQSVPKRFEWPVEKKGPGGSIQICGGELLFLLDGPTRWGDFLPLYAHCAQVGIWRLAIVCQQDRDHRSKLPVPLPFDRGL